jgi:heme-degrading monooxygenase HmoA
VSATREPGSHELIASTNDPAVGSVLTVQELRIQAGREQEFLERFRRLDVLRLAGGVSDLAEAVLVQRDDHFEVVSTWPSVSGIEAWIGSKEREHVRTELEPLYAEPARVTRYEVLARYSASGGSS